MIFQIGDHVLFKKKRCCGRVGVDWKPGTVKSVRNFEGHYVYQIWGYSGWVKQEDIKQLSK